MEEACLLFHVPKEAMSILVGARGRNICLVGKHSGVLVHSNREGEVRLLPRNANSNLALAQRMIRSIVCGGILRWFTHPSSTDRYYPASVRAQLQALVADLTQGTCTLQLLRAHSGHLCLFVMPSVPEADRTVEAHIADARPKLLARILELAGRSKEEEVIQQPREGPDHGSLGAEVQASPVAEQQRHCQLEGGVLHQPAEKVAARHADDVCHGG